MVEKPGTARLEAPEPKVQPPAASAPGVSGRPFKSLATRQNLATLTRVGLPAFAATALGYLYFDNIALAIRGNFLDEGTVLFLNQDNDFVPNFLTVGGLLFSILAGNAYSSLYQQQEAIYFALFQEVSEAKSLLEQATLVCQGRPFYPLVLEKLRSYVKNDLRRLDLPPADLLSSQPSEDPLEAIMYMTSVGVPSVVYETVRNLRQARGYRLGATQRKFPALGIALLYVLAILELAAFPLLGAGTVMSSTRILSLQAALFGGLCGSSVLVLRIIEELWQASGGVFNVDEVLARMVRGLENELLQRSEAARLSFQPARGKANEAAASAYGVPPWRLHTPDQEEDDDSDSAIGGGFIDSLPWFRTDSAAARDFQEQSREQREHVTRMSEKMRSLEVEVETLQKALPLMRRPRKRNMVGKITRRVARVAFTAACFWAILRKAL
jgi:hypothetical protein